jgi:cytochrome b6-f complex iron-sulfur subunit
LPEDPEASADLADLDSEGTNRRDFFSRIGVAACAAAVVGSGAVTLDFLRPRVLFEPPTRFRAGLPVDYPEGVVRFNKQQRAYVVGTSGGVYALSAVCTHLGCITRFLSDEKCIACPCHGSRFDLEGNVIHGPAPRPLPWLEVQLDPTGNLLVDTSVTVSHGKVFKA